MVLGCLGLPDETDIEDLTSHLVSVGAFVVCTQGDSGTRVVVLDPQQLVAALKSVMNHRYVGVHVHDEDTAALLESPDVPLVLVEEELAMAKLAHCLPRATLGHLEEDEASYVKDQRVTRCFLEDVLLCADRSRCGLRKSSTSVGNVIWELLQRLECGVVVDDGGTEGSPRATMLLPFLYTLRPAPSPSTETQLGRLGLGVSRDMEGLPSALSRPVNGHMLQHRFVVALFPSDLMARVMQSVLSLRSAHCVVECMEGTAVWMSNLCVRHPSPVVENVVVWWSPDREEWAPPADADVESLTISAMVRKWGRSRVNVVGWHSGGGEEVKSALCSGFGAPFTTVWSLTAHVVHQVSEVVNHREFGVLSCVSLCL